MNVLTINLIVNKFKIFTSPLFYFTTLFSVLRLQPIQFSIRVVLDIDDDGRADALTDGLFTLGTFGL